jgi:plasmid stabilization system protein ParE
LCRTSRRTSRADVRPSTDGTTRHASYALSQRARKRIEEAFDWINTTGGLRKTHHRGRNKVRRTFTLTAAYNLTRQPKLLGAIS